MGKNKEIKKYARNGKRTVKNIKNGKISNSNEMTEETKSNYNNNKVIWVFDMIDRNGDFAFEVYREDFCAEVIFDKMINYNSMKWYNIDEETHDKGKSKHHFVEDWRKLSKKCIDRMKKMKLEEEIESLFSFALTNTMRIWGLRKQGIFHVLWYDPKHEIYPSKKKHT